MILGITGSVGTGKSTVSGMLEKEGAFRIDADRLAHEAIEPGRAPYRAVVRFFGKRIVHKDGSIDRAALAGIVFKNRRRLQALTARVHPYVIRRIREEIAKVRRKQKGALIVVEVPLLHEARLAGMFDKVVTVSSTKAAQKKRWTKGGRQLKELKERSASQLPLAYKKKHSDFIIDNSGSIRETREQVRRILRKLHSEIPRPIA